MYAGSDPRSSSTIPVYPGVPMVKFPTPPWARRRDRCPNCLAKVVDDRAVVCDACGYQLRLPRISIAGLLLIAVAIASFFVNVFGNFLFPWPLRPFGIRIPLVDTSTLSDVFWVGVILIVAGAIATFAGAYAVRRRSDLVLARGPAA